MKKSPSRHRVQVGAEIERARAEAAKFDAERSEIQRPFYARQVSGGH